MREKVTYVCEWNFIELVVNNSLDLELVFRLRHRAYNANQSTRHSKRDTFKEGCKIYSSDNSD